MKYIIVSTRESTDKLAGEVQDLINQDWEPLGGMAVGATRPYTYYQAVIKRAPDNQT